MICKQCKQAFNGSVGICHLCGTDHNDYVIQKVEETADIQNQEPIVEKDVVTPKPEKKKKGGK